jgi:hypothetical protein
MPGRRQTWYGKLFERTFTRLHHDWHHSGFDRGSRTKGQAPPRPQSRSDSISSRAVRGIRHPNHWTDPDGR